VGEGVGAAFVVADRVGSSWCSPSPWGRWTGPWTRRCYLPGCC